LCIIAIGLVYRPVARPCTGGVPDAGLVLCAALVVDTGFEIKRVPAVAVAVVVGVDLAIGIDIAG